jgi:hypothetical protein
LNFSIDKHFFTPRAFLAAARRDRVERNVADGARDLQAIHARMARRALPVSRMAASG